MNIDQIVNVGSLTADMTVGSSMQSNMADQASKPFSSWLVEQTENLNQLAIASENAVAEVAEGNVENLHQIILGMEKAKKSFELAVQVRNKLLEGYQEVLRMQV